MLSDSLIGTVIDAKYEIRGEIARGGMATVYRAHQLSMGRDVAIKILPREFLHEATFLGRFRQEAELASKLEHRAIVPVYDYGEWEGIPYIVMRNMEGRSVDSLLEQGPITLKQAQTILRQIAAALDYAHRQNVLHRDLKPSNILLDSHGDAYITDFGIARILSTSNEKLTVTGVVGTPAYMSPEQAQGLDLDPRSDIYSLGVMLFEMLTGRRPFDAETPYSIAVMQVTQAPPSPRDFNPTIPYGVEAVILRTLNKDRNQRYNSARELADALESAEDLPPVLMETNPHRPPVTPIPPTSPYQAIPPSHITAAYTNTASVVITNAVARRRQPAKPPALIYLGLALLISLALAVLILGGYLLLSTQSSATYNPPDFSATGVFRLTATAAAIEASSAESNAPAEPLAVDSISIPSPPPSNTRAPTAEP